MSDQEKTKLGVMLESLQDLFKLIPTNSAIDSGMIGMLTPVLEQGLVLIARKVNKLQPSALADGQRMFGQALEALSDGLASDDVSVQEYADRLQIALDRLKQQVKAQAKAAAA